MIKADLDFPDFDCQNTETAIYFQILDSRKEVIDSAYIFSHCKFSKEINLRSGSYEIILSTDNHKEIYEKFEYKNEKSIHLGVLKFSELKSLDEVVVRSKKEDIIIHEADKTIYNVENNELLNSGTLWDAISNIPGMIATPEGGIIYNGQMISVWIDGQPSQLSGDNLVALLNSFPAGVIEKIEVIPNPGAAYDANSSSGIINVITKTKSVKGFSGSFNDNFSYSHEKKPRNNMSVNLNGRIKKWNLRLTMGNYFNKWQQFTESQRRLEDENQIFAYLSETNTSYYSPGNYIRTNVAYATSENSTLTARFNFSQNERHNNFETQNILSSGNNIIRGRYDNLSNNKNLRLQFNHKLDTLDKRINIYGYYGYNKSNGYRPQTSNFGAVNLYSVSDQLTRNKIYVLNADGSFPFQKPNFTLELGGKYNTQFVTNLGQYNFNNPDESILEFPIYNDLRNFKYENTTLAFYTQLKKTWGNFHGTAGLRWEDFKLVGKDNNEVFYNENFSNFYPSFFLKYNWDPVQIYLNYTRNVSLPSYSQINPNLNGYYDQFFSETGNPNLKPRFSNNGELKVSFMEYLYLSLDYSQTKNQVFDIFEVNGPQVTRVPTIFDSTENLSFNFQVPVPFAFFTEGMKLLDRPDLGPNTLSYIVFFGSYNQTFFTGNENFFGNTKPNYWWLGSYTNILLPKKFIFNMYQMWIPTGQLPAYRLEAPIWRFDITLYKYFFDKNLKVSLGLRDVFNSMDNNLFYYQPNVQSTYFSKYDSQKFNLSLTWKIGKYKNDDTTGFAPENANSSANDIDL